MGREFKFYHCNSLKDQFTLEGALGLAYPYKIPLAKILHTLGRKGYLRTVIWEKEAKNPEYEAECEFYSTPYTGVHRLHFLAEHIDHLKDLKRFGHTYGGYCDLRPDNMTVISARINQYAVIRRENETYAYLCCSMPSKIEIRDEAGVSLMESQILTFPSFQKDYKAVMCSQAALLPLIEYWNFFHPGTFNVQNVIELNRRAGIPDKEVLKAQQGRGMSPPEILKFFEAEGVPVLPLLYGGKGYPPEKAAQDIYSFVESRIPVLVVISTDAGYHALLFLGHTYDRNSWTAMADIGYFQAPTEGGEAHSRYRYHPNTTWIKHFIVHDDNFGPFYFFPTDRLQDVVEIAWIILPDGSATTRPTEAADVAFDVLSNSGFIEASQDALAEPHLNVDNKFWLQQFLDHLAVGCGEGLVLRPVLIQGGTIIGRYFHHELENVFKRLLEKDLDRYFWYIELTWPDIYCHRQMCCGSIIIDPRNKKPIAAHIPGVFAVFENDEITAYALSKEDNPRAHYGEFIT